MSLTKLLPVILLMMATGVQASTRDEIERLWHPQGMAAQPAQPAADTPARTDKTEKPAPRWFRLSNGCRRFYGADGYRSADVRREKRCEISRWCYSLPEYPASRRE